MSLSERANLFELNSLFTEFWILLLDWLMLFELTTFLLKDWLSTDDRKSADLATLLEKAWLLIEFWTKFDRLTLSLLATFDDEAWLLTELRTSETFELLLE